MTWHAPSLHPDRAGYFAVRVEWCDVPSVAHWSPRDGWRLLGRRIHGLAAWCELPPYRGTPDVTT